MGLATNAAEFHAQGEAADALDRAVMAVLEARGLTELTDTYAAEGGVVVRIVGTRETLATLVSAENALRQRGYVVREEAAHLVVYPRGEVRFQADVREVPLELAAAQYEASAADRAYMSTWFRDGYYAPTTESLYAYREACESLFERECAVWGQGIRRARANA